ncbi:MAG: flavodoxin family protein [SAR202 cluster bacterium]|nr:flavodoxin family protein [SAR202 cluster bacterium]
MKAVIVYDSQFGNTEAVAKAIASGMGPAVEARAVKVDAAGPADVKGAALLVAGSPVQAWRATPKMVEFLKKLEGEDLAGVKAAAFDTRIPGRIGGLFGTASKKLSGHLQKLGYELVDGPQGFHVTGTEGPLADGELQRATAWGRSLAAKVGGQALKRAS